MGNYSRELQFKEISCMLYMVDMFKNCWKANFTLLPVFSYPVVIGNKNIIVTHSY